MQARRLRRRRVTPPSRTSPLEHAEKEHGGAGVRPSEAIPKSRGEDPKAEGARRHEDSRVSTHPNQGRANVGSTTALLMLAVLSVANAGCSLIYTRGPQPEVQPPPPCTTSYVHPIADTVIAAASVAALVWGSVTYAEEHGKPQPSCFLCYGNEATAVGFMVVGGLSTLVFTPSAVVGYNRTAACRASLATKPQQPASPPQSSLFLVPQEGCPTSGDAPRVCSSAAPFGPSAVVLGEAVH